MDNMYGSLYARVGNFIYQTNPLLTTDVLDGCTGPSYTIDHKTNELWYEYSYCDEENSLPDDIAYESCKPELIGIVEETHPDLESFLDRNTYISGYDIGVYKITKKNPNIVEYLEERRKLYVQEKERCKNNTKAFTFSNVDGFVIEELEYLINHFEMEEIKNVKNKNK